jgi:hypothetical protein
LNVGIKERFIVDKNLESIQRELWDFLEKNRGDIELLEQWEALKKNDPDFSTPKAWLEFFGTWVGDDFDEVFPGVRNPSQTHTNSKSKGD